MNPPKNTTKTLCTMTLVLIFTLIASTVATTSEEDLSTLKENQSTSRENHSTLREEYESKPLDESLLNETNPSEDVKLATNSLVPETTVAPDFPISEDEISNPVPVPPQPTEENSRLLFGREMDQEQNNHSSEQNHSLENNDHSSTVPLSVPFPTGPELYETTGELESDSLTSEEIFAASSHEVTSDLDDTSMFSTSSVFSRLPPEVPVKHEDAEENPHPQETYKPRGKYTSDNYNSREKQNPREKENLRQRPTTDSLAFMSRSDIIDDSHTSNEATQKTTVPKQKTGKTIKTYKSSADQVLRQFVENGYLRHPLACIVDTTDTNLRKAQILWNATLRSNAPLDMVLSGYNSTGVAAIYSFKNSRTLLTGLNSLRESGRSEESGQAYTAILKTSVLIPYDSAIFLSTDDDPTDMKYFDQCATVLIKKRIRLYLIWFGDSNFEDNEASQNSRTGGRLGELSLSTGGEILHIPNEVFKNPDLGLITLFARTGIQEPDFDLVMDSTLSAYYTPRPIPSTPTQQQLQQDFLSSSAAANSGTSASTATQSTTSENISSNKDSGEDRETTVTEYSVTNGGGLD